MTETYTQGVMKDDGTPLFSFDTDNQEFARGFEAGGLFLQMALNPGAFEMEIQSTNATMLRRMADATERAYVAEPDGNYVLKIRVMPKEPRRPQPDPDAPVHLDDGPR